VQAPERRKNGHFWVLVAPERHVLFEFSKSHDSAATAKLLDGYSGFLVADAHVVYDHLYRDGQVIEVGCWAHCRRYFFKALASDPERSKQALAYMSALFNIEGTIADEPRKKKEAVRDKKSRPIVRDFFTWCQAERDLALDDSPIATAIGYAINQQKALERFLDDGRLPMTNNISERNLRKEAVGRKNWLFVGSEDGAVANTTFVSLITSAYVAHREQPCRRIVITRIGHRDRSEATLAGGRSGGGFGLALVPRPRARPRLLPADSPARRS
jgi:transposase